MNQQEIEQKLDESLRILACVLNAMPPNGREQMKQIQSKLLEIQTTSYTMFSETNKDEIEFSQLNRMKQQLTQLSVLIYECRSLVEFLEHSHASYCNHFAKDER